MIKVRLVSCIFSIVINCIWQDGAEKTANGEALTNIHIPFLMLPSRMFGRRWAMTSGGSVRESDFRTMYTPISTFGHTSTYSTVRDLIESALSGYKLYAGVIESKSTLKQCIPDGKTMCKRPKSPYDIMMWSLGKEQEPPQWKKCQN